MPPSSSSSSSTPGSEPGARAGSSSSSRQGRLGARALLRASRPRFWVYLAGPFVVGLLAAARAPGDLLSWRAVCFGAFFLFPANLFVYGVNDAYDFETDARNAKKQGYEARLERQAQRGMLGLALGLALPFLALALAVAPPRAVALLGLFFLLSHQYSAPPIRAKSRPLLDSLFNGLYACPAFFAYALLGGRGLAPAPVLAAWCWTMAMHAYSAVPDIQADAEAGVSTIATALGLRPTLLCCAALYASAALASYAALGWLSAALGAVYVGMMLASVRSGAAQGSQGVLRLYRLFPALNTLAGLALFWRIAWIKFAPEILAALSALAAR